MDLGAAREKEHLLALKVMRLTKPSLMPFHPAHMEDQDLHSDVWKHLDKININCTEKLENFGCGEVLTLPQHFGNIFLGENFSSYISVHNGSSQVCSDVIIKSDLQTSSQRLPLTGINNPTATTLQPNASIDDVIHHEVKELGTHILVCAVSYASQSGEKLYFRKFFKFQVLKPLDVKTKFYNAESDEVYLEAQIQNITPSPIHMDNVSLQPSPQYSVTPLNTLANCETKVFGRANYITPMDIHQYLYCLTPKTCDNKSLKGMTDIGKLDIVWHTNMGEKGRLQTSQLQRVAPGYGDIRLSLQSCPDVVTLESTFDIRCRVTNCCERSMDLTVSLQNHISAGMFWSGVSGRQLGKLSPNSSILLNLTLIATSPGLQTISGLRLTDTFLKRTYEHDEIAQIFVYTES